jgi:hypothetical protein
MMPSSSVFIPNITVFIDTMIFLHFKSFEVVDWQSVFNAKKVELIISSVIFKELDLHKDSHPNLKLRKRAKSITRKLHQIFENDTKTEIRPNVTISYILNDLALDFEKYSLDSSRRDDQQLAIILDYKNKHASEQIVILTNDFNLRQRAKLLNIETKKMPDEYELPDELDPNEKLIKELQQQIIELQNQRPILSLKFTDGSDRLSTILTQPILLSSNEIQQRLEQIKNRFPKMGTQRNADTEVRDPNRAKSALDIRNLQLMMAGAFGGYSETDIQEYNSNLDDFFISYEKYLNERAKYDFQNALTRELKIVILNSGTAPAEDLDVYLHFPDGFELADNLADPPAEPKSPVRPLTAVEKLALRPYTNILVRPPIIPSNISRLNAIPPNVSNPKIRRTESYEVQFHVRNVKHNKPVALRPLYLTFDSFESAKSFGIQYRINAGNVPYEVKGFLNVIINKTN